MPYYFLLLGSGSVLSFKFCLDKRFVELNPKYSNIYTRIRCISAFVAAITMRKEALFVVTYSLTPNSCLSGICSYVDVLGI